MEIFIILICFIVFYKIIFKIINATKKISNIASDKIDIVANKLEFENAKNRYKLAVNLLENYSQNLSKEDIETLKKLLK